MNDLLEFLTRTLDHIVGNIQDTHTHMYVLNSDQCVHGLLDHVGPTCQDGPVGSHQDHGSY